MSAQVKRWAKEGEKFCTNFIHHSAGISFQEERKRQRERKRKIEWKREREGIEFYETGTGYPFIKSNYVINNFWNQLIN